METLNDFIQYLKKLKLPPDFYGELKVRFRRGRAVLLEANRTHKLDDEDEPLMK
jgi:hypothetical protein